MIQNVLPRQIVDRQLLAYNARDLDAYCALFASDAVISRLGDAHALAAGIDAIRAYYLARFDNPRLHCSILGSMQLGEFVLDHELVTGIAQQPVEMVAIYEVRDSLIRSVRFAWPRSTHVAGEPKQG